MGMDQTDSTLAAGSSRSQLGPEPTLVAEATVRAGGRSPGEQLFLTHLPDINRVARTIARRNRLSRDEIDEFTAVVHLRFIKGDYAVLRQFEGRSTLNTFLAVVIQRLLLDFRAAEWGKWRPSMSSRRHGGVAVLLERLTVRDGLTFEEAFKVIAAGQDVARERVALEHLYAQFRNRLRPRSIGHADLTDVPACSGAADEGLQRTEATAVVANATRLLTAALATIPPQDRVILKLRYADGLQCSAIAKMLCLDQKPLYVRIKKLTHGLRRRLEAGGVQAEAVLSAIDLGDAPQMRRLRECGNPAASTRQRCA